MKRILAKQNHYKSLINTFSRHPEFAGGKTQLQHLVAELESREKRMSEIITDISRPVSCFYSAKQQAEQEMNKSMYRFTGLGKLAAYHKQDETKYTMLKTYQEQLHKVSAYRLYLNAIHVAEVLQTLDTNLGGPDFHSRQLPAFRTQAEDFGAKLTALAEQLLRRKALRKELAELIASTNLFLRDEMDNAVNFQQDSYPDFYREYHLIRQPHERKRRRSRKVQPEAQEASLKLLHVNQEPVKLPELVSPVIAKPQQIEMPVEKAQPLAVKPFKTEPDNALEYEIPDGYIEKVIELIFVQTT